MEYVLRAGRSLGNGVYKAAGAFARGTRRVLAYVPLLGIAAVPEQDADPPTKAPEAEAPVENNVAHDVSTTESADEAPKVAPPAVPNEAPASPPTAPAITEDVASVTKAIEEIDISDKAVAAAVNEAIECNTNEIIADAHHQNNINE